MGLIERIFRAAGVSSGQSGPAARALVAQQVRLYQPPGVLITEELTKLLDTAARFVEKGGTLTVEAMPDPPLGIDKLGYFRTPGPDLIGLLAVTATLK